MMGNFKDSGHPLRSFDAFPKRPTSDQVRSERGAFSTFITYFCIIFLLWVEFGGYIDGYIDYQFGVDPVVRENLDMHLDILVAMPCKYLDANIRDQTDDRLLCEELLNFEGFKDTIPEEYFARDVNVRDNDMDTIFAEGLEARFATKGNRVDLDFPMCRIYGTVPINRVQGDFHITAEGHAYYGTEKPSKDQLNFTHYISELSFGTFYPFINNNLDMTYKKTEQNAQTFHYSLKVVPTEYKKLGVTLDTNQYSVSSFETSGKYAPGIFFKYDFEPIKMSVIEERMSFLQFLIKIVTVIGCIWVIAQWLYKAMEHMILVTFGEKVARRGQEKKTGGLLDHDTELETI